MSNENTTGLDIDGIVYSTQDYLNFAQARRIKFVQGIESAAGTSEDLAKLDPDRQANYLAALRDLEKQSLVLMKMEQDKEDSDAQNRLIAEAIVRRASDQNIQRSRAASGEVPDASLLPTRKLIPGETEIGDRIENYQEWKSRTGLGGHLDPQSDDLLSSGL